MSSPLLDWVTQTILLLGYPGIAFLMTMESIILPLPSEAILPFAGYLVSTGEMNLWLVTLAATVGSLLGSALSYAIGRYGGRQFIKEYGRYLFLNEAHLEKVEGWFLRYGNGTVFVGRLLPVVRHFISIPAGIAQMRPRTFFLYTAAGAFVWNLSLTWVGFALGENWERITDYTAPIEAALVIIVLLVLAWYIVKAIRTPQVAQKAIEVQRHVGKQLRRITRKRR